MMKSHWKRLIFTLLIGVLKIHICALIKLNKRKYWNHIFLKRNYKSSKTFESKSLLYIPIKRKTPKATFLYKIWKVRKNENQEKYIGNKYKSIIIFATTNFFNPKKFKDIFRDDSQEKEEKQGLLDLDKVKNLKEINPDLYIQLKEYNEEKKREEELDKEEKGKGDEQTDEKEKIDKNTPLYRGLPILMIDGKDFEGFADSRKKTISPKIAIEFSNEEYDNVVGYDTRKDTNVETQKKTDVVVKTKTELEEKKKNEKNEMLTEFEQEVELLLKHGKEKEEKTKNKINDPLHDQIEKYKKVGKHYYTESNIGEILFDRNYPGYIHFNHGENIKELDEQAEYDSEHPYYINPSNVHLRTGRKREEQKKKDSGIKQKKRWNLDNNENKDIKRGNWKYTNDTVKDLLDSTDQEKIKENYYSNNYYQRTNYNTGFGNLEKVQNYYFDAQFIGSAETYPVNISVGMNFIWPINFIPLLCKQYTKRLGQPIKSELFNLGGFDSLQIWFYPDGMNNSIDGYCSIKLIMRPGSYLPVKIFFFAFSEYNYIHTSPFFKESAEYVTSSLNFCKLLLKTEKNLKKIENNKDYIILGPAGNVYIGVGIFDDHYDFDEDLKKFYSLNDKYKKKEINSQEKKTKFQYKYDWDEGVCIFDNWLKKQTAITDDKDELLPVYYTHSDLYENYKYKYVPEKNPFKFLNKKKEEGKWNRHAF